MDTLITFLLKIGCVASGLIFVWALYSQLHETKSPFIYTIIRMIIMFISFVVCAKLYGLVMY